MADASLGEWALVLDVTLVGSVDFQNMEFEGENKINTETVTARTSLDTKIDLVLRIRGFGRKPSSV